MREENQGQTARQSRLDRSAMAVAGLSSHALEHLLPSIHLSSDFHLTAVATRDAAKAARVRAAYPWVEIFEHWPEMIASGACGTVLCAASPWFHLEVARKAFADGKNLFLEKPCAANAGHFGELCELALTHSGSNTFVNYNFRFAKFFSVLEQAKVRFGRLEHLDLDFRADKPDEPLWRYDDVLESQLYGVGVHPIEFACRQLGPTISLSELHPAVSGLKVDYKAMFSNRSGQTVRLRSGNTAPAFEVRYEATFANGQSMVYDNGSPKVIRLTDKNARSKVVLLRRAAFSSGKGSEGDDDGMGYLTAINSFGAQVRGTGPAQSRIQDSSDVYRMIADILSAIRLAGR